MPSYSQFELPNGACCGEMEAFWVARGCGLACLQGILARRRVPVPSLAELGEEVVAAGGYVIKEDAVNGLIYAPFVEYLASRWALHATVAAPLTMSGLTAAVAAGAVVMASVHHSIRDAPRKPPHVGGHLVNVWHHDRGTLSFTNPSAMSEASEQATLSCSVFAQYFAMRGIIVQ